MVLAQERYNLAEQSLPEEGLAPKHPSSRPRIRQKRRTAKMKFSSKVAVTSVLAVGFFLIGIGLTLYYIYPTRLGYQVVKLEQEVAELERQKEYLELEVARATSLERIENLATNELAMLPSSENGAYIVRNQNPLPVSQIASSPNENQNQVIQTITRVVTGELTVASGY